MFRHEWRSKERFVCLIDREIGSGWCLRRWLGDWEPISVGLDFGVDIEEWEDGGDQRTAVSDQQSAVSGQRSAVSEADILARAMEGLEQTQAMKARMQGR